MAKANLTAARLRELLSYNADTGIFTRIQSRRGCAAGTLAGSINTAGYCVCVEGVHIPDDVVKKAVFLYMTRDMK